MDFEIKLQQTCQCALAFGSYCASQGRIGAWCHWPSECPVDLRHANAYDLPAFEQRLRAAGQRFETKPLADSGIWQIFLTDPDGARVELSFSSQR